MSYFVHRNLLRQPKVLVKLGKYQVVAICPVCPLCHMYFEDPRPVKKPPLSTSISSHITVFHKNLLWITSILSENHSCCSFIPSFSWFNHSVRQKFGLRFPNHQWRAYTSTLPALLSVAFSLVHRYYASGLAEHFFSENVLRWLIFLWYYIKKQYCQNFSSFYISWHSTSRLEITKTTKIIIFPYFLIFFWTFTRHETKIRAETIVTNIYELTQRSFAANVKQVAILCGFAWMKCSALKTAEGVSALTELSV